MPKQSRAAYIKSTAVETGKIEGSDGKQYEYWIAPAPMEGSLNGYLVFPEKPVKEKDYMGILVYVPVHGGITFCEHCELGSVYGFDTLHHDSDKKPRKDPAWIRKQIKVMLDGILLAAELEDEYLTGDRDKKIEIAEKLQKLQAEECLNTMVRINLLSGEL